MNRTRTCGGALLGVLAISMAGCASTGESMQPQQTVRSEAATAPADLQLLCASAVAIEFNTDPDKTLPISSAKGQGDVYQVTVTADQRQANCFVNSAGVVQSIVPL